MSYFFQLVISGIVVGSIYALSALGFVLIYKSTSILNLAQGEFLMFGAYVCLSMTLDFGLNFVASFVLTLVFSVILGLAVERLVLRPLIGETWHGDQAACEPGCGPSHAESPSSRIRASQS